MNARVLAEVAHELDLGAHLLLGKGEDAAGGRAKQSILADAFEAVVAAVYLDAGFATARDLVLRCLQDRIAEAAAGPGRPRLQDAPPGARRRRARSGARATSCATRVPTTPSTSSRPCSSATSRTARAKAARRSRPSRPRPGSRGRRLQEKRASGGRRCRSYLRSKSCAATSRRRSSARRSRRSRSPGTRSVRRHKNKKDFIGVARRAARSCPSQRRGKYLVLRLDGTDALIVHLGMSGQLLQGEVGARQGAEAHARRDHVHAGRVAALRRSAHVRRDVRHAVRRPRPAGRGARAPRPRSARDRALVGAVRPHARRAARRG